MKIIIENLGPVRRIEFDSQKSLSLFCGINGSGKTYVASVLNYVLRLHDLPDSPTVIRLCESFERDPGHCEVSPTDFRAFLKEYAQYLSSERVLGTIFALHPAEVAAKFPDFVLSFDFDEHDFPQIWTKSALNRAFRTPNLTIKLGKTSGEDIVRYELVPLQAPFSDKPQSIIPDTELLKRIFRSSLSSMLVETIIRPCRRSRMLTVERNSVYTFVTELTLNRSRVLEQSSYIDTGDPADFIRANTSAYPFALTEALDIARSLKFYRSYNGPFSELAAELENTILEGKISITDTGKVEFIPHSGPLNIHMASSSVKTLSSLVIYLRCLALPGDMLIVDEPELNLHPLFQILLTSFFAKLIKAGLRLIISTHSPIMMREFNIIMLGTKLRNRSSTDPAAAAAYTEDSGEGASKDQDISEDITLNPHFCACYDFDPEDLTRLPRNASVQSLSFGPGGFVISNIEKVENYRKLEYNKLKGESLPDC